MHAFEREHLGAMARTDGSSRATVPRLRPDSYDAGKSPHWFSDRVIHLRDEVALIEPVLTRAGSPLALVGHSYDAAVALIAALANPGRARFIDYWMGPEPGRGLPSNASRRSPHR
jgi:pimeloyl-ACP methyl ester carboxylesterase